MKVEVEIEMKRSEDSIESEILALRPKIKKMKDRMRSRNAKKKKEESIFGRTFSLLRKILFVPCLAMHLISHYYMWNLVLGKLLACLCSNS